MMYGKPRHKQYADAHINDYKAKLTQRKDVGKHERQYRT